MAPNPYRHEGTLFDLRVEDVAEKAGRGKRWVYNHAESLGGIKRPWGDGKRETLRFPNSGLATRIRLMGLVPVKGK